jgi:hypothetical protein
MLIGLLLNNCRKDDLIPVSGLVSDPNQAIPVEGVTLEIWTQKIESGIFSANYTLSETTKTGPDGRFSFHLENKNYTGIRLIFSKDGYYGWTAEVNIEKLKTDHSFYGEYQLLSKAWLNIRVKNDQPFSSDDYFEFRMLNVYTSCDQCCKGEKFQFTGMEIDQSITCQTSGGQTILIQWSKRKNGQQVFRTDSYFIPAFNTTEILLFY